jgi:hypothetical protein
MLSNQNKKALEDAGLAENKAPAGTPLDVEAAPGADLKSGARAQIFEEDPTGLTSELI